MLDTSGYVTTSLLLGLDESVVNQENPGLGITSFGSTGNDAATAKWVDNVPVPTGFNFYLGAKPYGQAYLSLAPNVTNGC